MSNLGVRMPRIRTKFVGLIGFLTSAVSILTGFLFVIIVTRRLSEADFGTWVWITRLIGYAVFPTIAVGFWTTRFVARDYKAAKTSLTLNLLLSGGATLVYLAAAPLAADASHASIIFFMVAAVQIPFSYLTDNLNCIAVGIKPQVYSYGSLVYEAAKVVLAFLFMTLLGRTLMSAIIAIIAAQIIGVAIMVLFLKDHLFDGFDKQLAWRWIRGAWIPLYNGLATVFMYTFDASIVIVLTGSNLILAEYGAAYVFFSLVISSGAIASALYPKLLRGGDHKDVTDIINLTALFAIPLAAGVFVIARPLLYLLNPIYADAVTVARLIILYAFMRVFIGILDYTIIGTEKVELNIDSKLNHFLKSRLFMMPSINLLYGATYLTTLSIVMYTALHMNLAPDQVAYYWALTQLLTLIPFFIIKGILAKKYVNFRIPWRSILVYLAASSVMVVTLQLLKFDIIYTPNIYLFVNAAVQLAATGAIIYFTILYIFDHYFRDLVKTILNNIRP